MQSLAAAEGIGLPGQTPLAPNDWTRVYFRKARAIDRLTVLFDEVPRAKSAWSFFRGKRKSKLSDAHFDVVDQRVSLRHPDSVENPEVMFRLFGLIAKHDLTLSAETENAVEAAVPKLQKWISTAPDLWDHLRPILLLPHAAMALRAMHRLGLLTAMFKEFHAIDSLVIRDYYHRYTVDEHTLVAIENLHGLEGSKGVSGHKFHDILQGIDRPDLLYLALLFHDVGKGMPVESHVAGSLEAVKGVFERLRLDASERETVNFLIGGHLLMYGTVLRRDIFDPEAVRDYAEDVGTIERLRMLALFTYADIKAVNPEALTAWKAEMLWQLYAAAENYLNRSVDDQRLYVAGEDPKLLERLIPTAENAGESERFKSFLDGFPKRYLLTHSPIEISAHYRMYKRLGFSPAETSITKRGDYYELVLVAEDRPFLFARVVGTVSSWGMNILKADAAANKAGTVLDTFRFSDRFHTLDHNPSEMIRLKYDLLAALAGEVDVDDLMRRKFQPEKQAPKVHVATRIHLDNEVSSHSTVIEIVVLDRPGLLYGISSTLAELGCNIEVALIDTEGGTATDVFYVTKGGAKLTSELQDQLHAILEQRV